MLSARALVLDYSTTREKQKPRRIGQGLLFNGCTYPRACITTGRSPAGCRFRRAGP